MAPLLRLSLAVLLGTVMLMFGCDEGISTAPKPPLSNQTEVVSPPEEASTSAFRFTGRDSFGVALKGHLAGRSSPLLHGVAQGRRCPSPERATLVTWAEQKRN